MSKKRPKSYIVDKSYNKVSNSYKKLTITDQTTAQALKKEVYNKWGGNNTSHLGTRYFIDFKEIDHKGDKREVLNARILFRDDDQDVCEIVDTDDIQEFCQKTNPIDIMILPDQSIEFKYDPNYYKDELDNNNNNNNKNKNNKNNKNKNKNTIDTPPNQSPLFQTPSNKTPSYQASRLYNNNNNNNKPSNEESSDEESSNQETSDKTKKPSSKQKSKKKKKNM